MWAQMRLWHCSGAAFSAREQLEWPQISVWCDCIDCVGSFLSLYILSPSSVLKKRGVIMDIAQFRGDLD